MGSGTVTSAENRAVIDSSTGVIERTNAAPSRTADWHTMASPMGPIVVDYRQINKATLPDAHPLPLIGNMLENQSKHKIFMKPDCTLTHCRLEYDGFANGAHGGRLWHSSVARGVPRASGQKHLFAARPISPIVDQFDAENRRVLALTPDAHGHQGPAREAVALIQQAVSGTRQNPTMAESSPTPMSGSRRFPCLGEESLPWERIPIPQADPG